MERGIRRALAKAGTGKDHPLGDYKAILDDVASCREGLKSVNDSLSKFSKYKSSDDSLYSRLGQGFDKADQQCFKQMSRIQTFGRIMGLIGEKMTQIGHLEQNHHIRSRNLVQDKLEPVSSKEIPDLIKSASKLSTFEADQKISLGKVENAKASLEKLRRTGKATSSSLFGKAEMTEEDHIDKIRNLEGDADAAESKLHDATEKVKLELLEFDAKTALVGDYFRILVNNMHMFHKEAAAALEELVPQLDEELKQFQPQFRLHSVSENCSEKQPVAKPVEVLVDMLLANEGLDEQGIFRLPGAISKVKQLIAALNAPCSNEADLEEFYPCNQTLASALKQFFRDLEYPLLRNFMDSGGIYQAEAILDQSEQFFMISELISKMATYDRYNLAYLCRFCREIMENHEKNLMTAHALAICWAPTLIGSTSTSGLGTQFVQRLIEEAQYFFPDEDYPLLLNQNLDFGFSERAAFLQSQKEKKQHAKNDDYGFLPATRIEKDQSPTKGRKKAAPTPPNAISLHSTPVNTSSTPGKVQILHSSTPNLSARPRAKPPVSAPLVNIQPNSKPVPSHRRPIKSPSATTDYTGFGLMEEDVVASGSSNEPTESSRLEDTSLADEITSQLDNMFKSTSQQPKPMRPPKPSSIKEFDNAKRPEGAPPPTPKPRHLSSEGGEYTQL